MPACPPRSSRFQIVLEHPQPGQAEALVEFLRDEHEHFRVTFAIVAKENGKDHDNPHIHIFVVFPSTRRFEPSRMKSYFAAVLGANTARTLHVETCYADDLSNIRYAKKEGDYEVIGTEESLHTMNPGPAYDARTQRNKDAFQDAIDKAKAGLMHEIPAHLQIRHYNALQKIALELVKKTERMKTMCGVWIWGPVGTGKTTTVEYALADVPFYRKDNMTKWWDGYNGEEYVLLDEFQPAQANAFMGLLKTWTGNSAFSVEFKGGTHTSIRPKVFIVTCNWSIAQVYPNQLDREAMQKRFLEIDFYQKYLYDPNVLREIFDDMPPLFNDTPQYLITPQSVASGQHVLPNLVGRSTPVPPTPLAPLVLLNPSPSESAKTDGDQASSTIAVARKGRSLSEMASLRDPRTGQMPVTVTKQGAKSSTIEGVGKKGPVQKAVSKSVVEEAPIPVPPEEEQDHLPLPERYRMPLGVRREVDDEESEVRERTMRNPRTEIPQYMPVAPLPPDAEATAVLVRRALERKEDTTRRDLMRQEHEFRIAYQSFQQAEQVQEEELAAKKKRARDASIAASRYAAHMARSGDKPTGGKHHPGKLPRNEGNHELTAFESAVDTVRERDEQEEQTERERQQLQKRYEQARIDRQVATEKRRQDEKRKEKVETDRYNTHLEPLRETFREVRREHVARAQLEAKRDAEAEAIQQARAYQMPEPREELPKRPQPR